METNEQKQLLEEFVEWLYDEDIIAYDNVTDRQVNLLDMVEEFIEQGV